MRATLEVECPAHIIRIAILHTTGRSNTPNGHIGRSADYPHNLIDPITRSGLNKHIFYCHIRQSTQHVKHGSTNVLQVEALNSGIARADGEESYIRIPTRPIQSDISTSINGDISVGNGRKGRAYIDNAIEAGIKLYHMRPDAGGIRINHRLPQRASPRIVEICNGECCCQCKIDTNK